MDLCSIQEVKALLGRHGFRFSKSMGQNFLIEDWVPRRIARECGADRSCGVLEIGPGIGCLTKELCAVAGRVVSVELDRALLPVLGETLAGEENFTLVPGDILKLDIPALVQEHFRGLRPMVCANLPYNITTPVLTALVEAGCFEAVTVMVQKEVAQRIADAPGEAACGAFSLLMDYHTRPRMLFEVPPSCFLPAPKVTSAVVRCEVRREPAVSPACGEAFLFRVVRAAFAQRRKTLCNALASAFGPQMDKGRLSAVLTDCGLPADVRGERLDLEKFALLADRLNAEIEKDREN